MPKVSIVIPTLDGSCKGNVERLLGDIKRQTIKDLEVILVKGVRPNGRARNEGVKKAQGDYLVFIDDDSILGHERVIENLVSPLEKDKRIGMTGASTLCPKDATWLEKTFARMRNLEFPVVKETVDTDHAKHACCALRKEVYKGVGWESDDLITGTDDDLRQRLRRAGYGVVVVPETWVYNHMDKTLFAIMRKSLRMGLGFAYACKVHPEIFGYPRVKLLNYQIKTAPGVLLYKLVAGVLKIPIYPLSLRPVHAILEAFWTAGFLYGWLKFPSRQCRGNS